MVKFKEKEEIIKIVSEQLNEHLLDNVYFIQLFDHDNQRTYLLKTNSFYVLVNDNKGEIRILVTRPINTFNFKIFNNNSKFYEMKINNVVEKIKISKKLFTSVSELENKLNYNLGKNKEYSFRGEILDGKKISNEIIDNIKERIEMKNDRKPRAVIILVGNDPASEVYVKHKVKACERANIESVLMRFESYIETEDLLNEIGKLNIDKNVDGYIVQLPLPNHIDENEVINAIDPKKDIDGFHPLNFGKMALGERSLRPATAYGVLKLLEAYKINPKGKHITMIGRSNIVGKPLSIMLGNDYDIGRATVSVCDIHTPREKLKELTLSSDIVIVAVGKPGLLISDMVSDGAIVIDVGINRLDNGKLVGDCDFDNLRNKCSYITPVPGGVGPMTIAGLLLNTYNAWRDNILYKEFRR